VSRRRCFPPRACWLWACASATEEASATIALTIAKPRSRSLAHASSRVPRRASCKQPMPTIAPRVPPKPSSRPSAPARITHLPVTKAEPRGRARTAGWRAPLCTVCASGDGVTAMQLPTRQRRSEVGDKAALRSFQRKSTPRARARRPHPRAIAPVSPPQRGSSRSSIPLVRSARLRRRVCIGSADLLTSTIRASLS
jgi:hypothetical protein